MCGRRGISDINGCERLGKMKSEELIFKMPCGASNENMNMSVNDKTFIKQCKSSLCMEKVLYFLSAHNDNLNAQLDLLEGKYMGRGRVIQRLQAELNEAEMNMHNATDYISELEDRLEIMRYDVREKDELISSLQRRLSTFEFVERRRRRGNPIRPLPGNLRRVLFGSDEEQTDTETLSPS